MKKITTCMEILKVPNQNLSRVCHPVAFPLSQQTLHNITLLKIAFKKSLAEKITIGLAAPQIGINERFFIVPRSLNYTKYHSSRIVQSMVRNYEIYINPRIISTSPQSQIGEENCLSVSRNYNVKRWKEVKLEYYDADGTPVTAMCKGLMSKIVQHETDHLNGITIDQIGEEVEEMVANNKEK